MDAESQQIEELKAQVDRLRVYETEVKTRCWKETVLENELFKANAEINRLKEENSHYAWRDQDKNKLITELRDALEGYPSGRYNDLINRATKVVKP